jgi:hypothetical protein
MFGGPEALKKVKKRENRSTAVGRRWCTTAKGEKFVLAARVEQTSPGN